MSPSDLGHIRINYSGEWWKAKDKGATKNPGEAHEYTRAQYDALSLGARSTVSFVPLSVKPLPQGICGDAPLTGSEESGLKATLPRRKILELFEGSKVRHLSAEDVYKALMQEGIDWAPCHKEQAVSRVPARLDYSKLGAMWHKYHEETRAADNALYNALVFGKGHLKIRYPSFDLAKPKRDRRLLLL